LCSLICFDPITRAGYSLPGKVRGRSLAAWLFILLLWVPTPSWAYRPFISTDAAVVNSKEIEIELGYFTLQREQGETSFIIPRVVINYGMFKNWEAVAELAVQQIPDAELNLIDAGVFVKGVLREGVLQDKGTKRVSVSRWRVGRCSRPQRRGSAALGSRGSVFSAARSIYSPST
jgi:hypothetical protein